MSEQILRIGVISASSMARQHMEGIVANHRARLTAVCDVDQARLQAVVDTYRVPAAYTDYRELISSADVDAVVVCTPDNLHREMTVAALRAGKHVLCEKPMALRNDECAEMVRAARECGRQLMIGQICRYTPGFVRAKELIDQGAIGELYFVESEYAHDYSMIRGANGWRADPAFPREPYIGGGCHAVDLLRWIVGDPTEVTAYSNQKCLTDWPVNDCTISIFRFPKNIIGKVFVSIGCKRDYTMRSLFYGTKGTIITDNTSPFLTLYQCGAPTYFDAADYTIPHRLPVPIQNHNTFGEIQGFVDAILANQPVPTSAEEGARTVSVCLAGVESARQGAPVTINYPNL